MLYISCPCGWATLTAKWIWCCAVPLLFAAVLPVPLHQVWLGVPQRSPSHGPLLQLHHATLRSADEIWPEELQSFLKWGSEVYSKQPVGRMNTVQLIEVNPVLSKIGFKFILKTSLICCLTLQKPSHTLVIAQRCRQHGNIMLGFSGDKGKSFSHKGNGIL